MVNAIYVTGTGFSGKTALCLGLYGILSEKGYKVGYFKPAGHGSRVVEGKLRDEDSILMKEIMSLEESLDDICPLVMSKRYLNQFRDGGKAIGKRIREAYETVKQNKDILLIESASRPEYLIGYGLGLPQLAKEFNAKVLLSVKGDEDLIAEKAMLYSEYVKWKGGEMLGVVINLVPFHEVERMKGVITPIMEERGLEVLGVIPDKREITLPTVREIAEALEAEVLTGQEKMDSLVDGYLIGAMTPESALSWLRRSVGKSLITGGDRADLILTALETGVSAIILTGNIYPSVQVLSSAEKKGVPILLVPMDTYVAVTKLDVLSGRIMPSPSSINKIELTMKIIGENVDIDRILAKFKDLNS